MPYPELVEDAEALGGPYYLNVAVRGILEADDGSIWFGGAKGGLSRYDGKTITVF